MRFAAAPWAVDHESEPLGMREPAIGLDGLSYAEVVLGSTCRVVCLARLEHSAPIVAVAPADTGHSVSLARLRP